MTCGFWCFYECDMFPTWKLRFDSSRSDRHDGPGLCFGGPPTGQRLMTPPYRSIKAGEALLGRSNCAVHAVDTASRPQNSNFYYPERGMRRSNRTGVCHSVSAEAEPRTGADIDMKARSDLSSILCALFYDVQRSPYRMLYLIGAVACRSGWSF